MWLISEDVFEAMVAGREAFAHGTREPTEAERQAFADAMREAYASKTADRPRNMQVAGGVASIAVEGALTETPDCFATMFGGGNTTYASIRKALAQAEADPEISRIEMSIRSPGGTIEGLFETLAAIEATKKPISVKASLAASAAYAIAAVAGPIEAVGPASVFGSIGVATRIRVSKDVVDVASKDAPNKRPDVTTEDGKAAIQAELDAVHELFADAIARGRAFNTGAKFDAARVNKEFGRGGTLLAAAAKSRGMIDSMPAPVQRAPRNKNATAEFGGAEQTEKKRMNKEELKAQHPELYAAVLEEGRADGKASELKRVKAHLKMGKAAEALDVAVAAIESGASVQDDEVFASYQEAALKRRNRDDRQKDEEEVAEAGNGALGVKSGGAAGRDPGDIVADIVLGKAAA